MNQRDRGNLEIHRSDADTDSAKLLEPVGGAVVEGLDRPITQERVQLDQLLVCLDSGAAAFSTRQAAFLMFMGWSVRMRRR